MAQYSHPFDIEEITEFKNWNYYQFVKLIENTNNVRVNCTSQFKMETIFSNYPHYHQRDSVDYFPHFHFQFKQMISKSSDFENVKLTN